MFETLFDCAPERILFRLYTEKKNTIMLQKRDLEDEKDFNDDHSRHTDIVQSIPGFQECDEEDVKTWMACDAEDCGLQMLNDDEIVTSMQEESDPVNDETDEDEDHNINESSKVPSNADALSAFETAMEWYEQQSECCPTQLLLLKRARDLSAKKRRCTMHGGKHGKKKNKDFDIDAVVYDEDENEENDVETENNGGASWARDQALDLGSGPGIVLDSASIIDHDPYIFNRQMLFLDIFFIKLPLSSYIPTDNNGKSELLYQRQHQPFREKYSPLRKIKQLVKQRDDVVMSLKFHKYTYCLDDSSRQDCSEGKDIYKVLSTVM
ncbi:uncharacterized protein TNCV_862331, partial [Trichonephila clavipes]